VQDRVLKFTFVSNGVDYKKTNKMYNHYVTLEFTNIFRNKCITLLNYIGNNITLNNIIYKYKNDLICRIDL